MAKAKLKPLPKTSKAGLIAAILITLAAGVYLVWQSYAHTTETICTWPKGSKSSYYVSSDTKYSIYGYSNTVKKGSYWWPESSYYQTVLSRIWRPITGSTIGAVPQKWRNANQRTIYVINSVAYNFQHDENIRFAVGDAYSEQHGNHTGGYDVDLYADTVSGALFQKVRTFSRGTPGTLSNNQFYNKTKTINLAKELIRTGKIDYIIYSDKSVVDAVQSWAQNNNYGHHSKAGGNIIQTNSANDHYDHFHVRVRNDKTFCGV